MHLGTSPMTPHHDLNVPYVRNEIKRLSQKYTDRMEEHPNIPVTNSMKKVKTTRRVKRKLPKKIYVPHYTVLYY